MAKVKINLLGPGWRGAEIADHTPLQTGLEDAYSYAYDTTWSAKVPRCTTRAIQGGSKSSRRRHQGTQTSTHNSERPGRNFQAGTAPAPSRSLKSCERPPHGPTNMEADLIRLAKLGYSAARFHVHFKRPIAFLIARAKRLGVVIKKPTRLPSRERSAITAGARMWQKSTN